MGRKIRKGNLGWSKNLLPSGTFEDSGESCPLTGPGVPDAGNGDVEEFNDDLFASLTKGNAPTPKLDIPPLEKLVPQKLFLSDRCRQLGYMIGPEVKKQDGRELEVGGFFLVDKTDETFTFRDFIVPRDLPVDFSNIVVAEHYDAAAREVRDERKQIHLRLGAMFHVHPSEKGGLYHSSFDDGMLGTLLNKMAKTTRQVHESPYQLIMENVQREYGPDFFCLKGDELSDAVQKFVYPEDQAFFRLLQEFGLNPDPQSFSKSQFLGKLLERIDPQTYEPRAVNFAVSFVFNNGDEGPYVKMAIEETFKLSGKTKQSSISNVHLEIVEQGINIPTAEEVAALVKERVKFPYKYDPHKGDFQRGVGRYIRGVSSAVLGSAGNKVLERIARIAGPNLVSRSSASRSIGGFSTNPYHYPNDDLWDQIAGEHDFGSSDLGSDLSPMHGYRDYVVGRQNVVQIPITPPKVDKTRKNTYYPGEMAEMFVCAALAYVADYRHIPCSYSTYLATLLDELSRYHTVDIREQISSNSFTLTPTRGYRGLRTCVGDLGDLVADNPKVVERHDISRYSFSNMIFNVTEELKANADKDTQGFIFSFCGTASSKKRNQILEEYVALVNKKASDTDSAKEPSQEK